MAMDLFHWIRSDVPMKRSLSTCHVWWQKRKSRLFVVSTFDCTPLPSHFRWTSLQPELFEQHWTTMNHHQICRTLNKPHVKRLNHCWTTMGRMGNAPSGWCFGFFLFFHILDITDVFQLIGGMEHSIFPFSWEFHHPKWRTKIFFRGIGWNHQPYP